MFKKIKCPYFEVTRMKFTMLQQNISSSPPIKFKIPIAFSEKKIKYLKIKSIPKLMDKVKTRNFFCTYFVVYIYQIFKFLDIQ